MHKYLTKFEVMIKEFLPHKITSSIEGYELLLRFHNDIANSKNITIQISFKNVEWFEANLVAVLGAMIEDLESKGNTIEIVEFERFKEKNDILFRNGFFPHYGIFPSVDSLYSSDTQIPYKKFKHSEPNSYNDYIQGELLNNDDFPKHSPKLGKEIKRNIYELFENARTHGKCSHIHTCGQFYPYHKKLNITIVDTGKTIVNNVQDFLKEELESCQCIDWAMQTGNTTKDGNTPGGLGLGLIFDFININEGKFQVLSSNGYWELKEGEIKKTDINFSFSGTIANLEFMLNDGKIYSFLDENIDLNKIF